MIKFKIGDIVRHKVNSAKKKWGFGIVKSYHEHYGLYTIHWFDGKERKHTIELIEQIA